MQLRRDYSWPVFFLAKVHYNRRIKILDCARGYTSSYALLQTNSARLGVTLDDPLEPSDINDDACIAKWQHPSPILPNDYSRLPLSLSLPSFQSILPSPFDMPLTPPPLAFSTTFLSTFLPHGRGSVSLLTPWDNLQSRNEAWRSIPSPICRRRRNDRTRRDFSSLSLSERDANKSSQTNIKWPRRTLWFLYTILSKSG